ncbi:uncharacterized protein LOC111337438 [Stylophora pistillata]|uniref:uncharacterized protein LOC111337438 n=1 Tax=Stylophora pistillata TaxID=50429 RepID=UPI000C056068|nr:uncharacterized protein LOC111337438 [Stylophora pistillata]
MTQSEKMVDSAKRRNIIRQLPQRSHKDSNRWSFCRKVFGTLLAAGLLFQTASAKLLHPCKKNQHWVDGTPECINCQTCPPGQTVSPECGNSKPLPFNTMGRCVPCQLGKSFSNEHSTSVCTPCSSCAKDQVVIKQCSRQADIKCGKKCYSKHRYYDKSKGDCLKCSRCCNDDQDVVEPECEEKLGSQSSMTCSFHTSINRCDIKSTLNVYQSTTESSQSSAPTTSSHTVITSTRASEGHILESTQGSRVDSQFASKSKDHSDSRIPIIAVISVVLLGLVVLVRIYMIWFRKSQPMHTSHTGKSLSHTLGVIHSERPTKWIGDLDGGTYQKKRTEVHYNSGSAEVKLYKPLIENNGEMCTSGPRQNAEQLVKSDSKPLESLLNSSELDKICELLDMPIGEKLCYEVVARFYGASYSKIKVGFQKGKSEAVIAWLVCERPELTVGEFTRVVRDKANRNDVALLLEAFDAKATEESTDM